MVVLKVFEFSPLNMGKWSNLTGAYFSFMGCCNHQLVSILTLGAGFKHVFVHPETWSVSWSSFMTYGRFLNGEKPPTGKVSLDSFLWWFLFTLHHRIHSNQRIYLHLVDFGGKITIWNQHFYPMKSPNPYLHKSIHVNLPRSATFQFHQSELRFRCNDSAGKNREKR